MTRRECAVSGRDGEAVPRHERAAGGGRFGKRGFARVVRSCPAKQGWVLFSSPYAVNEVLRNLPKLRVSATNEWLRLRPELTLADDVVSLDRPAVFAASKDRPILFTALASADVLLTLDKADFADILGGNFYGLRVLLPYDFLEQERAARRL